MRDHGVQLYQEEEDLAAALTRFVGAGLALGQGVVFLGSTARWQATTERLRGAGVDTHGAVLGGQLRLFGAKVVLSGCMRHGVPERAAFNESIGGILQRMRARYPVLRVFAGLSDELWTGGKREAAGAIERFWNTLEPPIRDTKRRDNNSLCRDAWTCLKQQVLSVVTIDTHLYGTSI